MTDGKFADWFQQRQLLQSHNHDAVKFVSNNRRLCLGAVRPHDFVKIVRVV